MVLTKRTTSSSTIMNPKTPPTLELVWTSASSVAAAEEGRRPRRERDKLRSSDRVLPDDDDDVLDGDDDEETEQQQCLLGNQQQEDGNRTTGAEQQQPLVVRQTQTTPAAVAVVVAAAAASAAGAVAPPPPPTTRSSGGSTTNSSSASSVSTSAAISYYLFLGSVILLWFVANGMNGIAMRSLATDIRHQTYSRNEHLLCILSMAMAVTAAQLLLAFALGCFLTLLYEYVAVYYYNLLEYEDHRSSQVSWRQVVWQRRRHRHDDDDDDDDDDLRTSVLLALLHGTAMYSTNLGFMYGSASLVQVIKLLEPFETVLLQNYLTQQAQQVLSVGVASSVVLTVGAAYTLVHADRTEVHGTALAFAVISTLSMSSRNVLQKQQQQQRRQQQQKQQQQQQQASSSTTTTAAAASVVNGKDGASILNGSPEPTRLEQALGQFTKLSLYAGLVMAAVAFVFHIWLFRTSAEYRIAVDTIARDRELNWRRILVWHLLFNSSSMISIAFVSALTHSLFNAGQRVCSVSMGILWFDDEQLTTAKAISMGVVSAGCCWYIVESQSAAKQAAAAAVTSASGNSSSSNNNGNNNRDTTTNWELLKPMVTLGLLQMILVFGYYENEDAMRLR